MAKKYTRKQVGSLEELDREQYRVKKMAASMESDWLDSILNPQQIALSLVTSLLSRKKNKNTNAAISLFSGKKNKTTEARSNKGKAKQAAGAVLQYAKQPAVTGLAKRVGISFLRWQAFNLAWFLGKKALKAYQQKRAEHKLEQQVMKRIKSVK